TDDVRGVEIGGAGKNVLAIACGIVAGRGLGESARAALIARAFAELMRFARAFGGRPETLMGLSGLGDLVLTASSPQSRNFAFGQRLGAGASPEDAAGGKLAEGAFTATALAGLAAARGIEMPVAQAVAAIVAGQAGVEDVIAGLLARPLRGETD
ncbi:MAG: NAD(P)H-dependent glycerol-3-phosphate dehydrogenase, partial [Microvirga sp.]